MSRGCAGGRTLSLLHPLCIPDTNRRALVFILPDNEGRRRLLILGASILLKNTKGPCHPCPNFTVKLHKEKPSVLTCMINKQRSFQN